MIDDRPLRIVHLSTYGANSGAGVAAIRIVQAERSSGMDASLYIAVRTESNSDHIHSLSSNGLGLRRWQATLWGERLLIAMMNGANRERLFKTSLGKYGLSISSIPLHTADIIHLHWTQHCFLSLRTLRQLISLGKPIVITMHDYWMATGVCQIPVECSQYQDGGCRHCPMLLSPFRSVVHRVFSEKQQIMSLPSIHWVAVSSYLRDMVSKSLIQPGGGVSVIGNPIDENVFCSSSSTVKDPSSPFTMMMVAARLDDPIKGFDYLIKALQLLHSLLLGSNRQIRLCLVGDIRDKDLLHQIPFETDYLGIISDSRHIATLYHKADIVLSTSVRESLSQTLVESLSCGIPVIARDSGGPRDIIIDGINGQIVSHESPQDMAESIYRLAMGTVRYSTEDCIKSIDKFSPQHIARQYFDCYQSLL